TNPQTGKPYGPDFPDITTKDIIGTQALLLDALKVGQLAAVVGFSYGGYLTFEWGVTHPERMRALVPVASAMKGRGTDDAVTALRDRFSVCPGWNGGDYYDGDGEACVRDALAKLRIETLTGYGVARQLEDKIPDPAEREAALRTMAEQWADEFDANTMIVLRKAAIAFNAESELAAIEAPMLYALSRTDALFGPDIAPGAMATLKAAGVDAQYLEIDSDYGHRGPSIDWRKWAPDLAAFLAERCP
ncbi:MAG: alpha/beta fold hydrolase, partial [Pseudomonadota bacterium]